MAAKTLIDDLQLVRDVQGDLKTVKDGVGWVRKAKKQIDEDTGFQLAQTYHQIIAEAHQGLAVLEEVKRVRISQKTSKVGGGRRKA